MIHLVVGMPGPFTDWCVQAMASLLRRAGVATGVAGVGRLEEAGQVALAGAARDTVCYAIAMDDALAHALAAAARGPVLAVADPRAAMSACLALPDLAPVEAFRFVLRAAVTIGQAGSHPDALRLAPEECAADPVAVIERLAARLDLALDRDAMIADATTIQPLLDAACAASTDRAPLEEALAARFGEPSLACAICDALGDYAPASMGALAEVFASAVLFQNGTPPHGQLRGPIDATGAARFLFVGGYLPLPIGAWEASILLDVSDSATEGVYVAEVVTYRQGQATVLAHNQLTLAVPGRHRVALTFRMHATDALVEVRLRSERAMFDGTVELLGVRFRRRDAPGADRTPS